MDMCHQMYVQPRFRTVLVGKNNDLWLCMKYASFVFYGFVAQENMNLLKQIFQY
jgi:hypothetical protein